MSPSVCFVFFCLPSSQFVFVCAASPSSSVFVCRPSWCHPVFSSSVSPWYVSGFWSSCFFIDLCFAFVGLCLSFCCYFGFCRLWLVLVFPWSLGFCISALCNRAHFLFPNPTSHVLSVLGSSPCLFLIVTINIFFIPSYKHLTMNMYDLRISHWCAWSFPP